MGRMFKRLFRPSSAGRWTMCAASPQREYGLPDRSSVYAEQGTRAHTALERSLRTGAVDPALCDDAEMVGHVAAARETVLAARAELVVVEAAMLEEKVAPFSRPDIGGTADILLAGRAVDGLRTLHVVDLKYGTGPVPASTPQLLVYAWGAADLLRGRFDQIKTTIIQPRGRSGGVVKTMVRTASEFAAGVRMLRRAIADGEAPDPKATPGGWCQFCKAKGLCAEYQHRPHDRAAAASDFAGW